MDHDLTEPKAENILKFLKMGYTLRDLLFRGISLKIVFKLYTIIRYKLYHRGKGVDIDISAVIEGGNYIFIDDKVWIQKDARLAVPLFDIPNIEKRPYLTIGKGTQIGPNCTISASNRVVIGNNVLFGINVLVLDHSHQYEDISKPVSCQGIIKEGEVIIEDNVWLAANSVVYIPRGKLVVGRNSVIAANTVVRKSIEPYTVVSGNPARVIKKYNFETHQWESVR
tara:strand:+ start:2751 stop:3425 length:675 start_codon:yes stop_codon:yes gene_type:complete